MPEFTRAQTSAIEENGKTLLVSAAAGSGKTTALIERILRAVTRRENPVSLDRLLVVTFTKAAAAELRLRISRALSRALEQNGDDPFLMRQITLLPSAKICTIDSFCLDLVRANFATLGLSPAFRVADENEAALLARETMERLIDDCYDDPDSKLCGGAERFARLIGILCGNGSDKKAADIFLNLADRLSAYPRGAAALHDKSAQLREYADRDFFDCPPGERIQTYLREMFEGYSCAYKRALSIIEADEKLSLAWYKAYNADYAAILDILSGLEDGFEKTGNRVRGLVFQKLGSYRKGDEIPEGLEFVKRLRADFKNDIKKLVNCYFADNMEKQRACILQTSEFCGEIGDLLCEYERRVNDEKKRRALCDFSDLGRYALTLLVDENGFDTPLAMTQKDLYDAVYIDEYQDVNAVQDRIFQAISTAHNRFMVGDIKQSIYAFRGAEPSIFAELRNTFPPLEKSGKSNCATVFFSENFRCNRPVIDFTNLIFDSLMPLISPETGYTQSDSLVFGKSCAEDAKSPPVKVVLVESIHKDSPDAKRPVEAEYIADEIARLVNSGTKKENGDPLTFGDFAILLRSMKGKSQIYADALRARGIPAYTEVSSNLLAESEIELVRCLLGAIDNPRRDICLAGALLSPLCNIDPDFLAALRLNAHDERLYTTLCAYLHNEESNTADKNYIALDRFMQFLAKYRSLARFTSAGELISSLYTEYNLPALLCGDNSLRRANLNKFLSVAYAFAGSTYRSLSEFLRYIRSIEQDAKSPIAAARPDGGSSCAVRIMSIHQSKGLEFPIVFVADAGKGYNLRDGDASPLFNARAGFGMCLRDESGFCVYDNLLRKSVSLHIKNKCKEEELRLLYVALTRARERLYVTAQCKNPHELCEITAAEHDLMTRFIALGKDNYMELVLLAMGGESTQFASLEILPAGKAEKAEKAAEILLSDEPKADESLAETLAARFSWNYPHSARTKIPAKLSVSLLYPGILDDAADELVIGEKKLPALVDAPRFLSAQEPNAAKRGTATHLFMQFFDFDNAAESGAESELRRLTEHGFLTADDASLVRLDEVNTFLGSDLFAEMRRAKRIYREQRFNLELDAAQFAADSALSAALAGETVLIQGVIDCFFYDENDRIILVDYKTDRVYGDRDLAAQKLRTVHSVQLQYYAKAIEQICGKPVDETLIYSLCLGDTVQI